MMGFMYIRQAGVELCQAQIAQLEKSLQCISCQAVKVKIELTLALLGWCHNLISAIS